MCFVLAGGMTGADIGVGWVDNSGQLHFQVNLCNIYSFALLISWVGSICNGDKYSTN